LKKTPTELEDGRHTQSWGSPMRMGTDFYFHHLGVACESIVVETAVWKSLGYRPQDAPFVDELQGIRGLFMVGGGPRIELLEATTDSLTLSPWIRRGVKLYHIGYLVASFDAAIDALISDGATIARNPMMSVYFESRISFLMMPNMVLVEVIEARSNFPASNLEILP
jgi:methylmalonyl-CoA/ethylmalonyl-CoA epimerase